MSHESEYEEESYLSYESEEDDEDIQHNDPMPLQNRIDQQENVNRPI